MMECLSDVKCRLYEGRADAHLLPLDLDSDIEGEGLKRERLEDEREKLDSLFRFVYPKDLHKLDLNPTDIQGSLNNFDDYKILGKRSTESRGADCFNFNFAFEDTESYIETKPASHPSEESEASEANEDYGEDEEALSLAEATFPDTSEAIPLFGVDKTFGPQPQHLSNNSVTTENGRAWSYSEEVHFVGAVFMALTEKGSLFPNSRNNEGKTIRQGESDTWSTIHRYFSQLKADSSEQYRERSSTALCRHFKHMKSRLEKRNSNCHEYLNTWLKTSGWATLSKKIQLPIQVKWNPSRLGNWSPVEEIVLVGACVQRFMKRGSLCNKDGNWCWDEVKSLFDKSFAYLLKNKVVEKKEYAERDGKMLQHHFKVLKKRLAREGKSGILNAGSPSAKYRFRSYFWAYVLLMDKVPLQFLVHEL